MATNVHIAASARTAGCSAEPEPPPSGDHIVLADVAEVDDEGWTGAADSSVAYSGLEEARVSVSELETERHAPIT